MPQRRCAVCFDLMGYGTRYAHTACWENITEQNRDRIIADYNTIIAAYERANPMRREISSTSEGTKLPVVSDAETMEKFKLSKDDYKKLPMLCQNALKEALAMATLGAGATNLWLVTCTDYDGNTQTDVAVANTGREALRHFASYHDYDEETEFDSAPTAYRLPSTQPFGMMRYGELEQANWSQVW